MLKMKLLLNTAAEQADQRLPRAVSPSTGSHHGPRLAPPLLDKETVFEWFGLHLDPARRLEFMCGLLHMCQPLELRFLGSYLEDLARRDYYVLRDFEFRANSPSELGILTDVSDPVVRSKLLVCLSLLGSDSRECAGILFQTLSRVDPAQYRTYDGSQGPCRPPGHCPDPAHGHVEVPLEQLMLLFTMASLHPTFHFHQRQILRGQLEKTQLLLEEERRQSLLRRTAQTLEVPAQGEDSVCLGECAPCPGRRCSRWSPQREAVHIERVLLSGVSQTKVDKEYSFKVIWSDSSSSSVTKSHSELENFLLKLPKDQCIESFVISILQLLNQGEQLESKSTEEYLRDQFLSAPPVFKHNRRVWYFFSSFCKSSCRCGGPRQVCHGDSSDVSSEDEESYIQDHKKKHSNKNPSQSMTGTTGARVEGPSRSHTSEGCESRSHMQPTDRGKEKTKGSSNGCLVAALKPKNAVSGPDTFESSTESSSCASSPQHRAADSRDSEEDQHRDSQPHLDDSNCLGPGLFFHDPASSSSLQPRVEPVSSDTDLSALSFMPPVIPPVPCVVPSVVPGEAPLPLPPPLSQSMGAQTKSSPGAVIMHVPPAIPGPGLIITTEKRDIFPTFGISSIGLPPPGNPSVQPLVQRFKALSHGAAGSTSIPAPLLPPMSTGLTAFCSNLQPSLPCQDVAPVGTVPLVETSHKLPGLHLPYPPAAPPSSVLPAQVQGLQQAAVPPVVPTHTPSPAPSPSPALTHSMAHSDCTSYSHSTAASGEALMPPSNTASLQPQQPPLSAPQQPALGAPQQPVSCGMCGCHCGGRTVSSPVFLHQMAPGARPLLTVPNLFPHSNYLPQAQANGTTLPHFYPPYGALHSHGHTDMLGLQQHMASFSQRMYPQVYPSPVGVLPATTLGGGLNKKNGSVSCFNCGVSGHCAQDCSQPCIDSTQQGGFRLKYAAPHITEGLDNADGAV